ncbi:hypothetical protein IJ750_01880 [bacterium]|nr:hypothetical protein [bacterium]
MNNTTANKIINNIKSAIFAYARTIIIAFLVALVFTSVLSIHAKNEMIKNLYANVQERKKMDELIARQLVAESDIIQTLANKKYSVCLQVGNLYETIQDYKNAEYAYKLAVSKAKRGMYVPYYKLASVLIAQGKYNEAEELINSVTDVNNKELIKFKTRAYLNMGDKYYSEGKFLSAAKNYEKSKFYYDRFKKSDKKITDAITARLVKSYVDAADIIVKNGYNSDAVRFLKKAEQYAPDDISIKYKLAIIYSDLDPVESVEYFEGLITKMPQYIDYSTYNNTLIKAANIADLEGRPAQAKYFRYRIHSIDLFVNNKVVYKNDVSASILSFSIKNFLFRYNLKGKFRITNESNSDIYKLYADFVLKQGDKIKEIITVDCLKDGKPLYSNGDSSDDIEVKFKKKVFTKKELENYSIDVYLYKDEKYKTLDASFKIPQKSFDLTDNPNE